MSKSICLGLFLAAAVAASALPWGTTRALRAPDESSEVARVRAHILGAERMAARRDLSGLMPSARKARLRLLRELRAYRERGVFPKNRDFPGCRVPYFVDAEGVRCAMAHLIEFAGGADLVRHVAGTRTNSYVRELVNEPGLLAWLDRNGLSVEEAARIQPTYGGSPQHHTDARAVAIPTALTLETAGVLLNLTAARTPEGRGWRGGCGIGFGFAGAVAGALLTIDPGDRSRAWGWSCLALGVTSVGLGTRQLSREPPSTMIMPIAWRSADGTPGIALRMAF